MGSPLMRRDKKCSGRATPFKLPSQGANPSDPVALLKNWQTENLSSGVPDSQRPTCLTNMESWQVCSAGLLSQLNPLLYFLTLTVNIVCKTVKTCQTSKYIIYMLVNQRNFSKSDTPGGTVPVQLVQFKKIVMVRVALQACMDQKPTTCKNTRR